jgi:hypothetical protein
VSISRRSYQSVTHGAFQHVIFTGVASNSEYLFNEISKRLAHCNLQILRLGHRCDVLKPDNRSLLWPVLGFAVPRLPRTARLRQSLDFIKSCIRVWQSGDTYLTPNTKVLGRISLGQGWS